MGTPLQWIVVTRTVSGYPVMSFGPFQSADAARDFMRTDVSLREMKLSDWTVVPFINI